MLRDYLPAKPLHPCLKQRGKEGEDKPYGFGMINIFYSDFSVFYYTCIWQALFGGCCFTIIHTENSCFLQKCYSLFYYSFFQRHWLLAEGFQQFKSVIYILQVRGNKSLVFSRRVSNSTLGGKVSFHSSAAVCCQNPNTGSPQEFHLWIVWNTAHNFKGSCNLMLESN